MSPYRQPETREPPVADPGADRCPDGELIPVLVMLWGLSVARVALGIAHEEKFGAEGTFAFLAVLAVPYLIRDAVAWWARRLVRLGR